MNTTAQTMAAHNGTPLHCRHLELGACTTTGGVTRRPCGLGRTPCPSRGVRSGQRPRIHGGTS